MAQRLRNLSAALLALALLCGFAPGRVALAAPEATLAVTEPDGQNDVLPEIDEFATNVMGDPWDMNESSDLAFFYTPDSGLTNNTFSNGVYSAQLTRGGGGERITFLTAGAQYHEAMRIGKIGFNYPINADHYRYLTFRMYSSNNACNSGIVQWFVDDNYQPANMGVSNSFLVPPDPCIGQPPGWYTYVLDLKQLGIAAGSVPWGGTIRELILHPFAGAGDLGSTVKIDWARLTAVDPRTARPYTIRWTGNGSGGGVTLYASPNGKNIDEDDIVIATNQSAGGGSYVFQTGVLPAGDYYIAAANDNGVAWSRAPLTINAPPRVTITKPSMTSGQDYAASVNGNAWDMDQAHDLNDDVPPPLFTCVTEERYAGGIYTATVPRPVCPAGQSYADPSLFLGGMNRNPPGTPDPTIDTNRFRYLSYRFRQSATEFSMSRFGWWQVNATDNGVVEEPVMSRDILILDGWQTYKIDLWADDIVDETYPPGTRGWRDSHPNRLRFDPNEALEHLLPVTIQLDWIKLTAMDEVARGNPFDIGYSINEPNGAHLTFFYDTDTNPGNGRTEIGSAAVSASGDIAALEGPEVMPAESQGTEGVEAGAEAMAGTLARSIYLPMVRAPQLQAAAQCTGPCLRWNTSKVSPGTYYICVAADDGYNTTYQCSEAPVVVR